MANIAPDHRRPLLPDDGMSNPWGTFLEMLLGIHRRRPGWQPYHREGPVSGPPTNTPMRFSPEELHRIYQDMQRNISDDHIAGFPYAPQSTRRS
jgi:hypothetical protein